MVLLLIANAATTVAEFAGIAGAMDIFGVSPLIAVPIAAATVWFLVLRCSYKYVERVLLALCLIYISYIASGFLVHPDWTQVFQHTVTPPIQLNQGDILTLIAVIGTTIAPWIQFYQQSAIADKAIPLKHLRYEQIDSFIGAFLTDFVAFFIVVCTGRPYLSIISRLMRRKTPRSPWGRWSVAMVVSPRSSLGWDALTPR